MIIYFSWGSSTCLKKRFVTPFRLHRRVGDELLEVKLRYMVIYAHGAHSGTRFLPFEVYWLILCHYVWAAEM